MRLEFRSHSLRPSTLPVAVVILAVLMAGQAVAGKKGGKGKRSRNTAAASGQSEGPKQAKSARQGGCIIGGGYAPDGAPAGNNRLKPPTTAACDLNAVSGLSAQILSQMQKNGIKFVKLDTRTAKCDAPCIPILEAKAANALIAAAKSKGSSITLLSAWQSSAEQYLQYAWSNSGICNAGNVTVPGTGLYEGGRTISTQYYSFWKSTLQAFGWLRRTPLLTQRCSTIFAVRITPRKT